MAYILPQNRAEILLEKAICIHFSIGISLHVCGAFFTIIIWKICRTILPQNSPKIRKSILNCLPVLLVARCIEEEIDTGLHPEQSRDKENDVAIAQYGLAVEPLVNGNWSIAN